MTACAMTMGMVPMALALERGSQMQAPLGRAVIGGLVMSTFATLLIVPSIFAIVIGKREAASPSIHPDDPDSAALRPAGSAIRRGNRCRRSRRHSDRTGGPTAAASRRRQPEPLTADMRRSRPRSATFSRPGRSLMRSVLSSSISESFRRRPPAGALAHGRPRGAGLPPRVRDRIPNRHEAPDRAG